MDDTKLTPSQVRILGSMVEKQFTTPMGYPMTPNAVRVACNQKSNRDPVVEFDDNVVFDNLRALERRGYVKGGLWDNTQTVKYKQTLELALGVDRNSLVVLAELFNRGPQTPGELRARCERMHPFASLTDLQDTLAGLAEKGLVRMLDRLPGTKEHRWAHLLSGEPVFAPAASVPVKVAVLEDDDRLARLEARVGQLEARIAELEGR